VDDDPAVGDLPRALGRHRDRRGLAAGLKRFGVAKRIVQGYIQFFRNTPPLVQLYFFFFAIGGVLPRVATSSASWSR
jgi:ABC-type amino acid transport system permease subunit